MTEIECGYYNKGKIESHKNAFRPQFHPQESIVTLPPQRRIFLAEKHQAETVALGGVYIEVKFNVFSSFHFLSFSLAAMQFFSFDLPVAPFLL